MEISLERTSSEPHEWTHTQGYIWQTKQNKFYFKIIFLETN